MGRRSTIHSGINTFEPPVSAGGASSVASPADMLRVPGFAIRPMVCTLLACVTANRSDVSAVEKCCIVLAHLLFEETAEAAQQESGYQLLRNSEKAEAERSLAVQTIEGSVPGGERSLVACLVRLIELYLDERHVVLQGMLVLMISRLLPEDPELKTDCLRRFKELKVPQVVYTLLDQPHGLVDKDLSHIGLLVLEYFAVVPPEQKRRRKRAKGSGSGDGGAKSRRTAPNAAAW